MYLCSGFPYSWTQTFESNDTDNLEEELCKLAIAVESTDRLRERKHDRCFFLRDEVDDVFLTETFVDLYP